LLEYPAKEERKMTSVDRFMRSVNRDFLPEEGYPPSALGSAISFDEYDEVFGVEDNVMDIVLDDGQRFARELTKGNKGNLVVLFECVHGGKKQQHHPSYKNPLEIELLCKKCHLEKHADIRLRYRRSMAYDEIYV
jgi:hypothetical protein